MPSCFDEHNIIRYQKTSLSCFDDKRFDLDDGIYKLAYFTKELQK